MFRLIFHLSSTVYAKEAIRETRVYGLFLSAGYSVTMSGAAVLAIMIGRRLQQQTRYVLCWRLALISFPILPLGTLVAAATLILLSQPAVKYYFETPPAGRSKLGPAPTTRSIYARLFAWVTWFYDTCLGIGHGVAPFRAFGAGLDLGQPMLRCPRNALDESREVNLGGAFSRFGYFIFNSLASFIVAVFLVYPIMLLFELKHTLALPLIFFAVWLALMVIFWYLLDRALRQFAQQPSWELTLHENGLLLKTPKIELRTRVDDLRDIYIGVRSRWLNNPLLMLLYINPHYIGLVRTQADNQLTVKLNDGTTFRILGAKAIFREEGVLAIIQKIWLTKKMPARQPPGAPVPPRQMRHS